MKAPIKVFISYSWDSEEHKNWIYDLATLLMHNGYAVILDQYAMLNGDDMHHFMEQSVSKAKRVLLILTPNYKKRADRRKGGVGYEYSIITPDILRNSSLNNKFITALREGSWDKSTPIAFKGRKGLDLTGSDALYGKKFQALIRGLESLPDRPIPKLYLPSDIESLKRPMTFDIERANHHDLFAAGADIELLIQIIKSLHPKHEKINELAAIYLKWINANPYVIKLAYKIHDVDVARNNPTVKPELLGFTCVIPLSQQAFKRYKKGELSEWKIGDLADDVVGDFNPGSHKYLLIQSIEFLSVYSKRDGYGTAFTFSLLRHIAHFNTQPVNNGLILIADGNKKGTELLQHYGFYRISHPGTPEDGRPRFLLDFGDDVFSKEAQATVDQVNLYVTTKVE